MRNMKELRITVRKETSGELTGVRLEFDSDFYWSDDEKRICVFFLSPAQLELFGEECFQEAFADMWYQLIITCDMATYYEMPSLTQSKKVDVEFDVVYFPEFARKVMRRFARMAKDGAQLVIPPSRLEFYEKKMSRGCGEVSIEFSTPEVREKFGKCEKGNDETFHQCVKNLEQIARNGTRRYWQQRTLHFGYDSCGFTFEVNGLYGGLIDHGSDYGWSTHT